MKTDALFVLRATVPMLWPIRADVGDYIAVLSPRSPDNLMVLHGTTLEQIRRAHLPWWVLWPSLQSLAGNGEAALVWAADYSLLKCSVAAGDVPLTAALRVFERVVRRMQSGVKGIASRPSRTADGVVVGSITPIGHPKVTRAKSIASAPGAARPRNGRRIAPIPRGHPDVA